jgi:hypothetical protein
MMRKLAIALCLLAACNRDSAERAAPPVSTTQPAPAPAPATPAPAPPAVPAVAGPKLPFVDEGTRDADFNAYRERLLAAVRARDVKAVAALADPKIRTSFGDGGGSADLEKLLPELEQILTLGGTFRGEGAQASFWAPYVYSSYPDAQDSFTTVAVIADDVPLRSAADANAPAIATLSRDIVELVGGMTTPWQNVKTADGKTGFVEAKSIRSPIDYRAGFNKTPQGWRMTALVKGD